MSFLSLCRIPNITHSTRWMCILPCNGFNGKARLARPVPKLPDSQTVPVADWSIKLLPDRVECYSHWWTMPIIVYQECQQRVSSLPIGHCLFPLSRPGRMVCTHGRMATWASAVQLADLVEINWVWQNFIKRVLQAKFALRLPSTPATAINTFPKAFAEAFAVVATVTRSCQARSCGFESFCVSVANNEQPISLNNGPERSIVDWLCGQNVRRVAAYLEDEMKSLLCRIVRGKQCNVFKVRNIIPTVQTILYENINCDFNVIWF